MLWIEKHKPRILSEMAGQHKQAEDARELVSAHRPGKAILFSGPPGVGKTLLAELLAKELQLDLLRLNASDERNADQIAQLSAAGRTRSLFSRGKLILIDEVDGISGQADRGGVPALVEFIRFSVHPVILIANDPWSQKLRPLRAVSKEVKFPKVSTPSIEKRLREIAGAEGVAASETALKNLARWSQGDLRSAITDLQTIALGRREIADSDLEQLGFRERESTVFSILPTIYRSKSLKAGRKSIMETDRDPDEVFLWVEHNLALECAPHELPALYDLLSRADVFRQRVVRQQFQFKGYMVDLMAGVSALRGDINHRFVSYQPPDRMLLLGRSRAQRALLDALCEKLGARFHCSKKTVKSGFLPFLRLLEPDAGFLADLQLTPEEAALLSGKPV